MAFWHIIKEVSAQAVRREAEQSVVLAVIGAADQVEQAVRQILGAEGLTEIPEELRPYLIAAQPPFDEVLERRLRHADVLVSLPGGPGPAELRPAEALQIAWAGNVIPEVLQARPDLRVPLGRRFPGFRTLAAESLIREVSRVNAEFTAISGISQSLPLLLPLFPAVAGADILLLTKNQILMLFRLAAIYGESYRLRDRVYEILPLLASALGWRTIARQLTGLVPAGAGVPLRIAISYSATYTVGRAAQVVFQEGRRPSRAELARIREQAAELGKTVMGKLRRRPAAPGENESTDSGLRKLAGGGGSAGPSGASESGAAAEEAGTRG